jgi:membrane-associated two-gene conflict system component 1 (EACC1)
MAPRLMLSIQADDATEEEISGITQELATWIGEAVPDCEVVKETAAGPEGGKGILEILGSLGVALLQPGALKSLIDCLAVYIKERRREVSIKVENGAGASVTLRAGGIKAGELDDLLGQLRQMMAGDRAVPA